MTRKDDYHEKMGTVEVQLVPGLENWQKVSLKCGANSLILATTNGPKYYPCNLKDNLLNFKYG